MNQEWGTSNTKAFAVLRVSSKRQKDGVSHETQEAEIKRYCEEHGLVLAQDDIIPIVESAFKEIRNKYAAAMDRSIRQKAQHILFYMFDRETRNLTDNEKNERLVKDGTIILHYVHDRKVLHKKSPGADFFMRDIQAVTNKHQSRNMGEKISDACKVKAEKGWFPGNHVYLGYMHVRPKDDKGNEIRKAQTTIIVDETTAPLVRREYELRAKGMTYEQIREQIVGEGLAQKCGFPVKKYWVSAIEWRLKNKFYSGSFDWKGIEYEGKHPLFIPKPIRDKVALTFGKKKVRRITGDYGALTGGWLTCADCGCNIVYDPHTKRIKATGEIRTYHLYHCTNGKTDANGAPWHKSRKGMYVSEDTLWEQFSGVIDEIMISEELAEKITERLNESFVNAEAKMKEALRKYEAALGGIDERKDQAYDLFATGTLDSEMFQRQIQRLKTEKEQMIAEMDRVKRSTVGSVKEIAVSTLQLATSVKTLWNSRSAWERREFLEKLLSNQRLRGATVEYELRKPFQVVSQMQRNSKWWSLAGSNR